VLQPKCLGVWGVSPQANGEAGARMLLVFAVVVEVALRGRGRALTRSRSLRSWSRSRSHCVRVRSRRVHGVRPTSSRRLVPLARARTSPRARRSKMKGIHQDFIARSETPSSCHGPLRSSAQARCKRNRGASHGRSRATDQNGSPANSRHGGRGHGHRESSTSTPLRYRPCRIGQTLPPGMSSRHTSLAARPNVLNRADPRADHPPRDTSTHAPRRVQPIPTLLPSATAFPSPCSTLPLGPNRRS
jgi:hypothetical protein